LLPLAPLANVDEEVLPGLVQRMAVRINAEREPRALKLWTATYLLMGLCYSENVVSHLLETLGERILDSDVRDWNSLLGTP
jgi:hypothetical protein